MTNQDFIKAHLGDDVRQLALQAHRYSGIDVPFCLQQISGQQTAVRKLPLWASTPGVLYPVHLSMEQCSSQLTAEYKAAVARKLGNCESLTDLTSGFGVDATVMGRSFGTLTYVERNADLCGIAANNLPLLGITHYNIICGEAEDTLSTLPHQSLIYLDPARRDGHGGKVVAISDCTPDLTVLQDQLLSHADRVMVKLSPMLDISNALRQLHHVSQIHIVSLNGECKELLFVMQSTAEGAPLITCANIHADGACDTLSFTADSERQSPCPYADTLGEYLYEPNASIMKGGCFKTVANRYGISKLCPDSHLYTSHTFVAGFPGRTFLIDGLSSLNKREVKRLLDGTTQANVTVRNFPQSVAELRKRLKLSEGGSTYLFATTLANGEKVLIKCRKDTNVGEAMPQ